MSDNEVIEVTQEEIASAPPLSSDAAKLTRVAVAVIDATVEITSCQTGTTLELPLCDVELVIAALRRLPAHGGAA